MKTNTITMTDKECSIALSVLEKARECMVWNEDVDEYQDNGDFLIGMDKADLAALTRAIRKIKGW